MSDSRQQPAASDARVRASAGVRFAIVASRWNAHIVDALVDAAQATFVRHGVAAADLVVIRVPGAWEIPVAVSQMTATGNYAAVVALGCIVRGDTRHYEHVADGCAQGLMQVQLRDQVPVLNGVLAVELEKDAIARAGGVHGNKGEEAALAALEMAQLWSRL